MSEEKKTVVTSEEVAGATGVVEEGGSPVSIIKKPESGVIGNKEVYETLSKYGADQATIAKIVNELGVESIKELAVLEASELTAAGMKLAKAKTMIAELNASESKPEQPATVTPPTVNDRAIVQQQFEALLQPVPNDESWLNSLKSGGVLKIDDSSYIAAIRAALADVAGLYDIPEKLAKAMEQYADETEEQVDPMFFSLRKSLIRRNYSEIFAAIDGLDGSFVTDGRRREFLGRIRDTFWPAIIDSYRALDSWYQAFRAAYTDPSMLLAALGGGMAGAGMSMVAPPDASQLHDAGDVLVDAINRVFRGTGVQIAAAMAYDANTIRNTLEKPGLPAMIGVKNRELMLKKIKTNVSSNYIRLEQNLVKYVLNFVKHDTVTSDVESQYFAALWQLGTQIDWGELNGEKGGIRSMTGSRVL